ncbi:MAG: metallophosphoesterase family protein [Chloroflexi bacterium]|nr:metallophosphoesterase family protein [Chloroflexota bacterium]
MRIGLISDTHIPSMGAEPPPQVIAAFARVDAILHAGDIYVQSCLDWLERIAPVHAVPGGLVGSETAGPRVSIPMVVKLGGHAIGMVHKIELQPLADDVWPGNLNRYPAGKSIPDELRAIFGQPVDIVVFGYTHEAMVETHQGVLFVNPGSPTMVAQTMKLGTVALLEVGEGAPPQARIVELASLGA